ncbi:MAG TPA: hypothetical protein VHZ55_06865, partial [Bryobacteraceae bacterium]|nr:hypothetical protein [Bryobacteraceae bacterium]
FPHPQQTPVSGASCRKGFWFDTFSIIANTHAKLGIVVPNLSFDLARARVPESISQQFAGDPVGIVLEQRIQLLPFPFYCHTEDHWISTRILGARQLLTRYRQ